jgi:hypothetical protein
MAGKTNLCHDSAHNDSRRREWRKRSGIRAIADHYSHEECRNACSRPYCHRDRGNQCSRRDVAGTKRSQYGCDQKEHQRNESCVASTNPDRLVSQLVQRPVQLRLCKQQRHTDERKEELHRETRGNLIHFEAAEINPDDPCHGDS